MPPALNLPYKQGIVEDYYRMKEYCVDLEIAKELKENGFPQICFFHKGFYDGFNLPTSDEILKELPIEIMGYILEIKRYEDGLIDVDYARLLMYESEKEYLIQDTEDLKLSNALAKLWLKLKKKGYIK